MEEIEIIAIELKTGIVRKKYMQLDEWHHFHKNKRKKGFQYIAYKKGFSQFKITNEKK
jgi:hypothetical protein